MVLSRLTKTRRGEATRSDRYEYTRPLHIPRQLLGHKPVNEGGKNHER